MRTFFLAAFLATGLVLFGACEVEDADPPTTEVDEEAEEALFPVMENNQWGFIDSEGRLAISPQFQEAWAFQEGRALIRLNDQYGYINPDGEIAIEPEYEDGWHFSDGQAAVKTNGGWGYIDRNGEMVQEPRMGIDPRVLETRHADDASFRRVMIDDQFGYRSEDGSIVIEPQFERAWHFSEDRARVQVDGQWGFIDTTGTFVVEPQYEQAWDFDRGLALVQVNGELGYINRDGEYVWEPRS